jgi:hypothetical protein
MTLPCLAWSVIACTHPACLALPILACPRISGACLPCLVLRVCVVLDCLCFAFPWLACLRLYLPYLAVCFSASWFFLPCLVQALQLRQLYALQPCQPGSMIALLFPRNIPQPSLTRTRALHRLHLNSLAMPKKKEPRLIRNALDNCGPSRLGLGMGDSWLLYDFLTTPDAHLAFERLLGETRWGTMGHKGGLVPRLVAMQGTVYTLRGENIACHAVEGVETEPLYRHPASAPPGAVY